MNKIEKLELSCLFDDLLEDENKKVHFKDGSSVYEFANRLKELIDISAEEFINDNFEEK